MKINRTQCLGLIAWAWTLGMGWLYLDSYSLRLGSWREMNWPAASGWEFPSEAAGALGLLLLVTAAAWRLGRSAGERLGLWRRGAQMAKSSECLDECAAEHAAAILGGLAALAMGVFILGICGLMKPAFFALFIAALGIAGWLMRKPANRSAGKKEEAGAQDREERKSERAAESPGAGIRWLTLAFQILACCALMVSLAAALAPAVESDGMRYHLYGPQEYLRRGRIFYIPFSAFTNFPFLVEMLFTLGLGLSGDIAAKLLHWIHLPLAGALVGALAARMSGSNPGRRRLAAWLAAALFLSTPVAAIVAGWSFIDLGVTAYLLAAIWFFARWLGGVEEMRAAPALDAPAREWLGALKSHGLLIASGFFAGAAMGAKYTCILAAGLMSAVAVWRLWTGFPQTGFRRLLRPIALFCLATALCSAPWFVKNVVLTGNPVYPLAHGIFKGGDWSAQAAQRYKRKAGLKGSGRGFPRDLIFAPFDTAFYWAEFETQNPGPGYLLLFPWIAAWCAAGAIHWRRRKGAEVEVRAAPGGQESIRRTTILWVSGFALFIGAAFFAGYKSNRFLLPVWALGAALGGAMIASRDREGANRGLALEGAPAMESDPPLARQKNAMGILSPSRALAAAALFAAAFNFYWTSRYLAVEQKPAPLPAAFGFVPKPDYLRSALSYYSCVEYLAVHSQPGEKAFYIGEHRGYPSAIPAAVSDWYDVPLILALIRETPGNAVLLDRLLAEEYRYVLFNLAELKMYVREDFQPLFQPGEWKRFEALISDSRLKRLWPEKGGCYVCRILPAASASARP